MVVERRPSMFSCKLESPEMTPFHSRREKLTTLVVGL